MGVPAVIAGTLVASGATLVAAVHDVGVAVMILSAFAFAGALISRGKRRATDA
jgi:hypothetical protein